MSFTGELFLNYQWLINIIFILALIPLGIWAGGRWKLGWLASISTGLIMVYLLTGMSLWVISGGLLGYLAEKISPGKYSLGLLTDQEKIHDVLTLNQINRHRNKAWFEIKKRPYLTQGIRGLINSLVYLPLLAVNLDAVWIFPAYIISWPLAAKLGSYLPIFTVWQWSEMLRHTLTGLFLVSVYAYAS
ncbi:MAG: hypothetical protein ACE5GZ_14010 [Gammaproteobacteria bacterium]